MRSSSRCGLSVVVVLALTPLCEAKPQHKQALVNHFGPFLPKKLDDCRTCHLNTNPDESDKAHNPFGARLAELRDELKLDGKPTDIPSRLEAIASDDTDGDGVANFIELLAGHYPGDSSDKPTAEELTRTQQTLTAF